MTPSAISPDLGRLLRGADPETNCDRDLRVGLGRGDEIGQAGRQVLALAGRADGRDDVDEAPGDGADAGAALGRRGRGEQRHQCQSGGGEGVPYVLGLAQRQVGHDRPGGAGGGGAARELDGAAVGQNHVRVGHQDHRHAIRHRGADLQSRIHRRPLSQGGGRSGVNRRSISERIGERDPQLDQVGTGIDVSSGDRQRRLPIGKASHHVGHQRSPALVPRRLKRRPDPLYPSSS